MLKSVSARRRAGANELPTIRLKKSKRPLPAKRMAVKPGTFTAEFRLPASQRKSAPENDVEMKDVEQEGRREAKVSITLPARLGRPKYKRVPIEKALFMNEALKDVPIEYIQDELAQNGQTCVQSFSCLGLPR